MSSQADQNISAAMRAVSQALRLDSSCKQMDAYIHYLKCVQYIVQILLNDSEKAVFTVNTKKCLNMSQQCLGRVEKLIDGFLSNQYTIDLKGEPSISGQPVVQPAKPPPTPTTPVNTPVSESNPNVSTVSEVTPNPATGSCAHRPTTLTPIEYAQRQNHQLMLAYKNRMAKCGNKSNTFNMSLSLQRQMAENMAIGKARQQALAKKFEERQKRFQQEAAKRLAAMGGMSKDEQERMYLYTKILEYEQDTKWPVMWRNKLKAQPDDEQFTLELIKKILKANDHPLAQLLVKYQRKIYNKVYPVVIKYIQHLSVLKVPFESDIPTEGIVEVPEGDEKLESARKDCNICEPDESDEIVSSTEVIEKDVESSQPEEVASECSEGTCDESICLEKTGSEESENKKDESETAVNDARVDSEDEMKGATMTAVVRDIKSDINEAEMEGKKVVKELERDNSYILKRLESFDPDEMDDLFDDSDENDELIEEIKTQPSTPSSSSLPYSSLTSRESFGSIEVQSDDGTIGDLEKEAFKRHLQNCILDVKESLDRLLGMFVVTYEQLGTPAGRDLCYSCLEEIFLQPLWPTVLPLFRLVNIEKEETAAKVMTRLQQAQPKDLRVTSKFCMDSEDNASVPYYSVIQELHKLVELSCPLTKLESIVKLCRLICQCVEEYYQSQEKTVPNMGADDLLPVMCYVIVRSGTPQIVSECHAMEEFIPEGYLMGEEGYCLTSLQTALGFCLQLEEST